MLQGNGKLNGNLNPAIQPQIPSDILGHAFFWLCSKGEANKILQQLAHKEMKHTNLPVYRSFYCSLRKLLCKNQDNVLSKATAHVLPA